MWGRTIYENVRKFVQFQLTMNISLLTVIFISACSIGKPPFKVIQLLWMNLVMDVLAACAICTEPFVHNENDESLPRESRKAKIIRPGMWRNILPQAIYQIVVMIILMFGGQAMFFEKEFNIIKEKDYTLDAEGKETDIPTDKFRKDVACFHTFMLMNIINMINCRVVAEGQHNVFKGIFNNSVFLIVFLLELLIQNAWVLTGYISKDSALKFVPKLFGVCDINWKIQLTAWMFGLFPLALRALCHYIPIHSFHFMDKIDLETKSGHNCVTRWADRAGSDLGRLAEEEKGSGVWVDHGAD
jgi:magnesium-transporting ATPase (P-type)